MVMNELITRGALSEASRVKNPVEYLFFSRRVFIFLHRSHRWQSLLLIEV